MSVTSLLIPVFVQVTLTFVLMSWMWSHRVGAIKSGEAKWLTSSAGAWSSAAR